MHSSAHVWSRSQVSAVPFSVVALGLGNAASRAGAPATLRAGGIPDDDERQDLIMSRVSRGEVTPSSPPFVSWPTSVARETRYRRARDDVLRRAGHELDRRRWRTWGVADRGRRHAAPSKDAGGQGQGTNGHLLQLRASSRLPGGRIAGCSNSADATTSIAAKTESGRWQRGRRSQRRRPR